MKSVLRRSCVARVARVASSRRRLSRRRNVGPSRRHGPDAADGLGVRHPRRRPRSRVARAAGLPVRGRIPRGAVLRRVRRKCRSAGAAPRRRPHPPGARPRIRRAGLRVVRGGGGGGGAGPRHRAVGRHVRREGPAGRRPGRLRVRRSDPCRRRIRPAGRHDGVLRRRDARVRGPCLRVARVGAAACLRRLVRRRPPAVGCRRDAPIPARRRLRRGRTGRFGARPRARWPGAVRGGRVGAPEPDADRHRSAGRAPGPLAGRGRCRGRPIRAWPAVRPPGAAAPAIALVAWCGASGRAVARARGQARRRASRREMPKDLFLPTWEVRMAGLGKRNVGHRNARRRDALPRVRENTRKPPRRRRGGPITDAGGPASGSCCRCLPRRTADGRGSPGSGASDRLGSRRGSPTRSRPPVRRP